MSYHKFTIIGGYDTNEANPFSFATLHRSPVGEEMDKCCAWNQAHYKNVSLRGHWKPETAWAYAQRRGWKNVKMVHCIGDMSGKGRGGRTEYLFSSDGVARCVAEEAVDVHEIWDEIESA